jgi:integrase
VRGLTYLKVVIKHVVVDDAGRPYHPDTLSDFLRELCGEAKVRHIRLHGV